MTRRLLVLAPLAVALAATAHADPVDVRAHAAPVEVTLPVAVPADDGALVPLVGTEAMEAPAERLARLVEAWRRGDGTRVLDGAVLDDEGVVWLPAATAQALREHERELMLDALGAALDPSGLGATSPHVVVEGAPAEIAPPRPASERDDVTVRHVRRDGALSGVRVAVSPGHGWYWSGAAWLTQRGDSYGLIEDLLTSTIAWWHVDPYLRGAGATTVWLREPGRGTTPWLTIDDGDAAYAEDGSFSDGASAGGVQGDYRFAEASATSPPMATWTFDGVRGELPVAAWWVPGANRTEAATFAIEHAGGVTTVRVDQRRGGPHPALLGTFRFDGRANVSLIGDADDGVIIADAVTVGTATGQVIRDGAPSGYPGWQECSRNHAEASGLPDGVTDARASERDSDVVARPLWANELDVDAYVSIHTNAAGGTGTETYAYSGDATPGSLSLREALHTQVVDDIRAYWNADWVDRGEKEANFGELRELEAAPGALIEVAFHDRDPDTGPDVPSLHDPRFRRIAGRAIARGVIRYFDPDAPFAPEPPRAVAVLNRADGLLVRWEASDGREGSGLAERYRVQVSADGRSFDDGTIVDGTELLLDELIFGDVRSVRVAGINTGGEGPPSPAVSARWAGGQSVPLALVNAYDRWDRSTGEEGNTFDYLVDWAAALVDDAPPTGDIWAFDGGTNEAFGVYLRADDYVTLAWQAGEESTVDATFSLAERALVADFLDAGGTLLASGSEIGWDLVERGSEEDAAFFAQTFVGAYIEDDGDAYVALPVAGGLFDGLGDVRFDDGSAGIFAVDFPDVFGEGDGAIVPLTYPSGGGAALLSERAVLFGFPVEAVVDPAQRTELLGRALGWLQTPGVAPDTEPGDFDDDVGVRPDVGPDDTGLSDAGDAGHGAEPQPDAGADPDTGSDAEGGADAGDTDVDTPDRRDAGGGSGGDSGGGCGCSASPAPAGASTTLTLLALIGLRRRGRRTP